jgi:hypothetical protein
MSVIHNVRTARGLLAGMFAVAVLGTAGAAMAGDALNGDEIKAVVADSTVQGKMNDGMAYAEFYQADGTIKGKDYTGKWTIEGDSMCFLEGTDPKKTCYQVGQTADGIEWMQNGKVEGTGTVSKGNINKY